MGWELSVALEKGLLFLWDTGVSERPQLNRNIEPRLTRRLEIVDSGLWDQKEFPLERTSHRRRDIGFRRVSECEILLLSALRSRRACERLFF